MNSGVSGYFANSSELMKEKEREGGGFSMAALTIYDMPGPTSNLGGAMADTRVLTLQLFVD